MTEGDAETTSETDKPLSICFLSSMHPARDKRVFEKEALSLAAAGFRVTHLCPGTEHEAGTFDGVTVKTFPTAGGLWRRLLRLGQLYRRARDEGADVLHCSEPDSWTVGVAVRLLHGGRCVFDVHEHYPSTFAESRFPRALRPGVEWAVRFVFRVLTRFTDRIVLAKKTVSADFHCSAEKKVLVRNFSLRSSTENRHAPRRPEDELRIVHLGLFNRMRGWPQVLDALHAANANARLQVIGTINDGSEQEFRDRAAELGLTDRIEVLEWMPFQDAVEHLFRAHVGLVAFQPQIQNHVFAMPHKLFDYMAAGLAVLVPEEAIEVAPIVEEIGCGLLIDATDPGDIAARIEWLWNHPGELNEMGRKGQRAVRELYNWEAEAAKLVDMYRDLQRAGGRRLTKGWRTS